MHFSPFIEFNMRKVFSARNADFVLSVSTDRPSDVLKLFEFRDDLVEPIVFA
jgi:hypothetical protein